MSPWESLLSAAQVGAEWAWEQLYRDLAPRVRGYLVSLGASDPDNLLGEVWFDVARGIGSFSGGQAGFRSWVFMIAHHRVIDERRWRGRRPHRLVGDLKQFDLAGVADDAETEALLHIERREVLATLDRLSHDQRAVLALRILGDLTVDEVALVLDKTPGAVKALQRRALRALRNRIEQGVPL